MAECKACGVAMEKPATGRRLYCSERCRKRQYDRVCSRCGGRASGTDPGTTATDLCDACWKETKHETSVAWLVAEAHHWADLYGQQPSAPDWSLAIMRYQQRAYAEGRCSGRPSDATLAEIERRHREDGPWPALTNVQKVFGTWNAFIEAAGFTPVPSGKHRPKVAA